MKRINRRRRRCRHCNELFHAHPAVGLRQKYCSTVVCQQARKKVNNRNFQKRNADYHRGKIAVRRIQLWRSENPGYWCRPNITKKPQALKFKPLQAEHDVQTPSSELLNVQQSVDALQAELVAQKSIFQGFAAHLTGCALQAELSSMLGQWHDKGMAIGVARGCLYPVQSTLNKGENNDQQKSGITNETTTPTATTL